MAPDLTLPAHAKINIGLRIVGRREFSSSPGHRSGTYHLLHTLFQEITFGDTVTLTPKEDGQLTLAVSGPAASGVPADESNLCLQAAQRLQSEAGYSGGVHIELEKRVPTGSGLGGGSSDAATVLKGLNQLWELDLSDDLLEGLAAGLGADVPFFIRGGLQLGEGIGDRLTVLPPLPGLTVALVLSGHSIDTAWAYGQFRDRSSFQPPTRFEKLLAGAATDWAAFGNDFEEVVFPRHPELQEIKAALLKAGAVYAGLSGSGSAVAGLFTGPVDEAALAAAVPSGELIYCGLAGG